MIIEKRRHIRVDDRLIVSWRPANSDEIAFEDTRDLMRASVNRNIHQQLAQLSDSAPDVAKVLLQLNHKLDLIADNAQGSRYGPHLTELNISQSGIAFEWRDSLPVDQPVRLTISLPPDNERVHVTAQVLECRPRGGTERVIVRCMFLPDQEEATEVIKRYVDYTRNMAKGANKLIAPERDDISGPITDYR